MFLVSVAVRKDLTALRNGEKASMMATKAKVRQFPRLQNAATKDRHKPEQPAMFVKYTCAITKRLILFIFVAVGVE